MGGAAKLLEGLTVVDLGVGLAPALVANFLADNGARVLRVEPAEGDPFHAVYPAYAVWRRSAERRTAADRAALDALLADADLCLLGGEDHPAIVHRFDAEAIAATHPRLVVTAIAGNPKGTAWEAGASAELLAQARSGLCYEHFSTRPIAMAFQPANFGAALQALAGTLGALVERERSGLGQIVRTSLMEGALTWVSQIWSAQERPTRLSSINQPRDPWPLVFRCADDVYVHLVMGAAGSKYQLYQGLGIDDPTVKPTDSGMPDPTQEPRNFYGNIDLLAEHVARLDSRTLLDRLWARGFAVEPSLAPGACWDMEQARFNNLVRREADGTRRIDSSLIADTVETASGPIAPPPADSPLGGMRVVDFGAFVAGPLASVVLADLGADVIKVETPAGDPSRAMVKSFSSANRGKRGIALDLKAPEALALARRLAASADAVTNNFRPGVSARIGIDPPNLHALRDDLVVLESPGYGAEGPLSGRGAFDPLMQAFVGHEVRAAGEGNPPFWNRTFMVDFAGGMLGGIAVLSGLFYRARTGNGVSLISPLMNAGAFLLSELIQHPDGSWDGLPPLNQAQTGYTPLEAMYQAGDGWVAIVARGDAAEADLLRVLAIETAGEGEIAAAVAGVPVDALVARFAGTGVWIEPCRTDMEQRLLADPELLARRTVRSSIHPEYGEVREIGTLFTLSRSVTGSSRPLMALGEHTGEVVASLSDAEAAPAPAVSERVAS